MAVIASRPETSLDVHSLVDIVDTGEKRIVRLLRPQKGTYSKLDSFETDWPEELLYSLVRLKREWFVDSFQRFEHPNYVQKQIDLCLELYKLRLGEGPILDFGCGFGASSYCMIRRGAMNIVAADLERPNTGFASEFFASRGLSSRVTIFSGDITSSLRPSSFSVIWLQAVMEHLLPEERRTYLRRFWESLMPGGILIITETPNRAWPVEGHTTGGTWWIPWMKPRNVFRKMRRREKYQAYSDVDFYRCGIIGSSYREILDCLGRPGDCVELSLHVRRYFKTLYARAVKKSLLRGAAVGFLGLGEPLMGGLLRRPPSAFMPFLNHLVFQKQ